MRAGGRAWVRCSYLHHLVPSLFFFLTHHHHSSSSPASKRKSHAHLYRLPSIMYTSPMFAGLNGSAPAKFPVQAPLEGLKKPTGVDLYARFALAGAIGVSGWWCERCVELGGCCCCWRGGVRDDRESRRSQLGCTRLMLRRREGSALSSCCEDSDTTYTPPLPRLTVCRHPWSHDSR